MKYQASNRNRYLLSATPAGPYEPSMTRIYSVAPRQAQQRLAICKGTDELSTDLGNGLSGWGERIE